MNVSVFNLKLVRLQLQLIYFLQIRSSASFNLPSSFKIQLMVLIDNAREEWPVIGHALWNGCHLADLSLVIEKIGRRGSPTTTKLSRRANNVPIFLVTDKKIYEVFGLAVCCTRQHYCIVLS
ncbi:heparan-alpha-glucosaminide N-acetyltransferase [Trifolium repens]|nr:heparan-alpha-glucosaminide N-acetyltransferase [Trifolium repens]